MISELIKLMQDQEKDLKLLLELMETQYIMIMGKDTFGLEGLVDKMNECGKRIAKYEVKRRELTGDDSIKEIVRTSDSEDLKEIYNNIRQTLNTVVMRKETNEILLKQQIMFNSKMLNIMNPNREIKTYNSYGNYRNKL